MIHNFNDSNAKILGAATWRMIFRRKDLVVCYRFISLRVPPLPSHHFSDAPLANLFVPLDREEFNVFLRHPYTQPDTVLELQLESSKKGFWGHGRLPALGNTPVAPHGTHGGNDIAWVTHEDYLAITLLSAKK